MARLGKSKIRLVRPAQTFPLEVKRIQLTQDNEATLTRTFNRFAQLCHCEKLSQAEKEDCLLLVTTCRNEWYTLNAMYVEAEQWCRQGREYAGFADAMNVLKQAISGSQTLEAAGKRAARILETSAHYIEEFAKKYDLFFNRFAEVHTMLDHFADTITDLPSKREFKRYYVEIGSGPDPDHLLSPSLVKSYEICRRRLLDWYEVTRPLTGLARTFISEVLEIGMAHKKTCKDYLREISEAVEKWPYGYVCPHVPPDEVFSWRRSIMGDVCTSDVTDLLRKFVYYCEEMSQIARTFLREMLSVNPDRSFHFPLHKPGEKTTIAIRGKNFECVRGMFVFIMDMRNSSGEPYRTTELKVKVTEVIEALCKDGNAASEFTYNDCRAVGCKSLTDGIQSVARIWHALEIECSPDGFGGLRMGAVCGDMFVGWRGLWLEDRKDRILMDITNTISCASRLMDLDKLRWHTDTEQGQFLVSHLGNLSTDESLIFFDASVWELLTDKAREKCIEVGLIKLRSFGDKLCWAVPIPILIESLT